MAIIGNGLAGAFAGAALARAGYHCQLFADTRHPGASAVPLALLTPHPGDPTNPVVRFRRRGFTLCRAWLDLLGADQRDNGCRGHGVLSIPTRDRERRWLERTPRDRQRFLRLTPDEAVAATGLRPADDCLLHPAGAWIRPSRLIESLLTVLASRIGIVTGRVEEIRRAARGWRIETETGANEFTDVIVAAGSETGRLVPSLSPVITPVRGQMTALSPSPCSAGLRMAVSAGGFLTPGVDGAHWAGATFGRGDGDVTPRPEDDECNREWAAAWWADGERMRAVDCFVGIRATTPDRLPLVGAVEDKGLWVSAGHGSHGLATAPLAAHLLVRALGGRSHPWLRRLDPNRFARRRPRPMT